MMMTLIARQNALPFEPLVPNEETVAAMRETHSGKLPRFEDADALMKQCRRLNAPRTVLSHLAPFVAQRAGLIR
jgi:hypothetical protein